jgi:hypothetical protein
MSNIRVDARQPETTLDAPGSDPHLQGDVGQLMYHVVSARTERCNVSSSPTDLSPNEKSRMYTVPWTKLPFDDASLGLHVSDRCVPTLWDRLTSYWDKLDRTVKEKPPGVRVNYTDILCRVRLLTTSTSLRSRVGTEQSGMRRPGGASSRVLVVQGTSRIRDASFKGRVVQETRCPRNAASKGGVVQGAHRPRDGYGTKNIRDFCSGTHRSGTFITSSL